MTKAKTYSIGCIVGTRTEIIKMAPVLFELKTAPWAKTSLISAEESEESLDKTLSVFNLTPDCQLTRTTKKLATHDFIATVFLKFNVFFKRHYFDALLAAGNTTTVFISSLVAFYHHIPFGHMEAGLSNNRLINSLHEKHQALTTLLSTWHFAPSVLEKENLMQEQIAANKIFITGSTVADALHWIIKNKAETNPVSPIYNFIIISTQQKGKPLSDICKAIIQLANRFEDINFLFSLAEASESEQYFKNIFSNQPQIHLLPPLRYDEFVHLMRRAILLLTDSITMQEEAPILHKPVLILGNEKPQLIKEGIGMLVGTSTNNIIQVTSQLLSDGKLYLNMTRSYCPEAEEEAAKRIVEILKNELSYTRV
ncbi:non-hydrolyzing UDP-N-acetylglucosamine 2-epimerase [Legionella clemsonensis]|uniref:UDP-N-acetylglucosamine 2-epimerase (non-hydrolyzing) n=1 Tax=Legionella clemsonensis TaxID=1867846 RepID=A0A222P1B2_9GAMM|nr:UDP-N-acetylglucosamine 2-epimerase (non-hydrolyzing) [Legionella clemsonensis]ASQ45643.1 UDP-N-acetylglucosamine 2-epimerase [Legionella clemsonensis]